MFKAVLNLAAVLCLCSTPGLAANISLSPLDNDPAHAVVAVEGVLVRGDHIKFRTQVGRLTKAVVAFSSDGGNLFAAIEIGKTIRLKSFATAVLDGQRCASACALAWLGGLPRFMGHTGHVGFHAAYIEKEGRPSESGVGNALVGSYLTQIGLSETAVVYITQAAPTELTLLTWRDAEKIGIEVLPFEQPTPDTKTAPRVTPRETTPPSRSNSTPQTNDNARWCVENCPAKCQASWRRLGFPRVEACYEKWGELNRLGIARQCEAAIRARQPGEPGLSGCDYK